MLPFFFDRLPEDVLNHIWEMIDIKIKPFISKTNYSRHHADFIKRKFRSANSLGFQGYSLFVIQNDISIALIDMMKNILDIDIISSYKKMHHSESVFFSYYDLLKFIGKKYDSRRCVEILQMCDNRSIADKKLYKSFITRNIR